jgi:potassium-dependent mechanosensitive channel
MRILKAITITVVLFSFQTSGYCQNPVQALIDVSSPEIQKTDQKAVVAAPTPEVNFAKEIDRAKRRLEVAKDLQARSLREDWPLSMKDLAGQNIDVAEKLVRVIEKTKKAELFNNQLEDRLTDIRESFDRTEERVESVGLTPAIGALLQKRKLSLMKMELPRSSAVERRIEIRRVNEEELGLEDLEDRVHRLGGKSVADHLEVMGLGRDDRSGVRSAMEKVLLDGEELIDDFRPANGRYLTILGDQSYAERAIRIEAKKFIDFINVNLLWARSNQSFGVEDLSFLGFATTRFLGVDNWTQFKGDFGRSYKRGWLQWGLFLIIFLGWIIFRLGRGKFFASMTRSLEISKPSSIAGTLKGFVAALLVAGLLPLLIIIGANLLASVPGCHEFTKSITLGLNAFASIIFFAGLARVILRPSGLGQVHFNWPESICCSIRRFAGQCMLLIAPLTLLLVTINAGFSIPVRGSLGRVVFIVEMVILALILIPLARPRGAVITHMVDSGKGFFLKTRRAWLPLAVLIPLSFLIVSFLGYYRTAFLLSFDMITTIALIGSLIFLKAFLNRWSFLAGRKFEAKEDNESSDKTSKQTLILIRVAMVVLALIGLYGIWSDDLPIFSFLNTIVLWTYHAGIDVTQSPIIKSTTLGNLLMCFVILGFTYTISRNLYGLLNTVIFKRFRVDLGSQHASTLIIKYIIAAIGLTLALDVIGITWSKFQWLLAALTVGLGFGLQEIVANFVSGIIILFERPISIGDTITVSGVEGKVKKIQIRATTITDWDNKEVLIPNKAILTTNITNWTLSNQIVRIVIPIGIAYGSNARKAEEILLKVVGDNALTVDDPAPSVIFTGFGDSSLDLKLRTYANSSDRMTAINQLHLEINDAFNTAGLEIPFPQQDVHLDTLKTLDVRVVKDV